MKRKHNADGVPHKRYDIARRVVGGSVLITIMLMGLSPVLHAKEIEDLPELPSIEARYSWRAQNLTKPELMKAGVPRLERNLVGTEVYMTFKISKQGKPYAVRYTASLSDYRKRMLGDAMLLQLENWKFTPVVNAQGETVEVRVALPVRVVAPGSHGADKFATVNMPSPILLAVLDR